MPPTESTQIESTTGQSAPDLRRRLISAAIVVGLYLVVQLAPRPAAIKPEGWRLLAIFVATIGGLILRPIAGGAMVLIAVTLAAVAGGLTIQQALEGYGDPTVWLVMAAFIISNGNNPNIETVSILNFNQLLTRLVFEELGRSRR
jgi:di/tricarboxylate transporter